MEGSDSDILEELASLPTFHHPTASPDGDEVALYYDVSGRNELHVLDVETGGLRQVSDGGVPRNAGWWIDWSADGDRVFFHDDDGGDEQNDVYAIDREGDVTSVVELDGQTRIEDVGDDGETLLVGSNAGGQMNLYRHDLPTGETTQLTEYERATFAGSLSPDCDRIAYVTNETDDFANMDVYVANADGSEPRTIDVGETGAETVVVDWRPDGDALLVGDNSDDLTRPGVYDFETDDVTWFGDLDGEEQPVRFLPDGERFLVQRTRDAAVVPVVYDATTGEGREFDLPTGVAELTSTGNTNPVLEDDRVLVKHAAPDRRPELLAYDLSSDEYETLLPAEYGDLDPDRFVDAEYFTFESHGVDGLRPSARETESPAGLEIGALLYDSGERPSPLVVTPHGGPPVQDRLEFDLYTQFLVSRGYSVLQVNYRGSAGRGREFKERLYGDWGGSEQEDIAEATRRVAAEDWVDEDRVAVFGGSYGGYSAYWQMVQYPELYAAGVAWIGVTDLEDMYENTMPHFRTELMEKYLGTPEENPDLYRERSPVEYVENLDAPLLMVHGVNDRRVPISQARTFRDGLLDAGYEMGEDTVTSETSRANGEAVDGDFEYVELGEEGHASSDIDQKIRLFRILDDFLGRRLSGTTAEPDQ